MGSHKYVSFLAVGAGGGGGGVVGGGGPPRRARPERGR